MAELIRILVVDRLAETHDEVARLLAKDPGSRLLGLVDTAAAALQAATQQRPDVILLDAGLSDMDAIELTERLGERSPGSAVVMTSVQADSDYVRRAMLAGARGFLVKPLQADELLETLRRLQQSRDRNQGGAPDGSSASDPGTQSGRIVAVFSPKGGVGRTTLAVNLAVAASEHVKSVALVDATVQFGDVGLLLNLRPTSPSIADSLGDFADGQPDAVDATLVKVASAGVRVLLAPPGPETAELIKPEHYLAAIKRLTETHQLVVVDCGPLLQDITLAILDTADVVLCLTSLDLSSIKSTRLFLIVADRIGYGPEKLKIVLNRADSPHGIEVPEVEQSIGRPVDFTIVSDGRAALHALNTGVPFAVGNKAAQISRDVAKIAAAVTTDAVAETADKPKQRASSRRLSLSRR